LLELALLSEKEGFGSLWIQEGIQRSPLTLSAAVLQAVRQIFVGTGVTSPFRRHPQVLALEAATLSELSGGRFILGIGAAEASIANYGLRAKLVQAMRDAFKIIRGILSQGICSYQGEVFSLRSVQKHLSAPNCPVYLGDIGSKMLELAGEFADGLLITRRGGFSPRYVKYAIDKVTRSAAIKGRDASKINFLAFLETSISKDRELAGNFIKEVLASYTIPNLPHIVMDVAVTPQDETKAVRSAYLKGDIETATRQVTDEIVDTFAIAGTPSDCLERLSTRK
jgi:5,10-methylenetetrahydromethanopterin reductase